MSEAALKRSVVDALRLLNGVHVLRLNAGATVIRSGTTSRVIHGVEPGTPDLLVMLPGGRVLWLELKTARGRLSPAQQAWHERARRMGHTVEVVRDVQSAVMACLGAKWSEGGIRDRDQ